ncbi:MAG: hypothetical protein K5930_01830 [Treponemataceae bacterium]|nr:hypothetical protein [Treponemataceae bacterium]
MIPESTVHITDKPLSSAESLREGSFVFVRVLDKKADGMYTVTFAGRRFSVKADNPLSPGESFPAKLSTDGKKLILLPDFSRISNKSQNAEISNTVKMSDLPEGDMIQYFTTLGLVPDALSKRIISFMQLMGVRIDPDKAAFIRELALKFPGHEQEAAEAASILEEKGIPVTEENVEKLMLMISGCGSSDNEFTAGVNSGSEEGNWVIIPYEYIGDKPFYGSVCLLKDSDGSVSRLKISSRKGNSVFLFRIYLNYGVNKTKIRECTVKFTAQDENGKIGSMAEKLRSCLAGLAEIVHVQYEPDMEFDFLSDDDIALVRAKA